MEFKAGTPVKQGNQVTSGGFTWEAKRDMASPKALPKEGFYWTMISVSAPPVVVTSRDIIYVDDIKAANDLERFKTAFKIPNDNIDTREIRLGGKTYRFDDTLRANTHVPISGVRGRTILEFSNSDKVGLHLPSRLEGESIYLQYNQMLSDIIVKGNQAAYSPTIENNVGVLINSVVTLTRVFSKNFGGDAFRIFSNLPDDSSNAKLYDCGATECNSNALHIEGGDANSIMIQNFDARDCKYGIVDESFLGNLYIKPMIHHCGSGITCISANQENLILHAYVEEDTPAMEITARNMSIGGQTRAAKNSNHLKTEGIGFIFGNDVNVGFSQGSYTTMNPLGIEFGRFNADARGMEIVWDKDAIELQVKDRWNNQVKERWQAE